MVVGDVVVAPPVEVLNELLAGSIVDGCKEGVKSVTCSKELTSTAMPDGAGTPRLKDSPI